MHKIMYAISCLLKILKNKMHIKKERRFMARNRSRIRKNILQNANEYVSDKQQNLEELVLDLEQEDIARQGANNVVSYHDVLVWVSALKNQANNELRFKEMLEQRQNQLLADKYFEAQKLKNIKDAQFLRAKTFWDVKPYQTKKHDVPDLDELYEKTRNLRRVVDVYNQQKIK